MPVVVGPNGEAIDLDAAERQFAESMAAPEQTEPQAPPPPKIDHDAPYGRKADGTPRQKPAGPGRPPKARTTTTGGKTSGAKASPPEAPQDSLLRRASGVKALFQTAAAGCLAVSVKGGDAFKADAVVLATYAEPFGTACATVAAEDRRFAQVLDRVTAAGPYASLFAVAVPLAAQLARNHGVVAMSALQAVPPEELLRQLDEEQPDAGSQPGA